MKKIYLIQQENTNLYKIGITKKNIEERIKELQTGNANKLLVVTEFQTKFNYKLETALHGYFDRKRINSEWFELLNEDVTNFHTICNTFENNFKLLKEYKNPFF